MFILKDTSRDDVFVSQFTHSTYQKTMNKLFDKLCSKI